jgi:hypothetical protein
MGEIPLLRAVGGIADTVSVAWNRIKNGTYVPFLFRFSPSNPSPTRHYLPKAPLHRGAPRVTTQRTRLQHRKMGRGCRALTAPQPHRLQKPTFVNRPRGRPQEVPLGKVLDSPSPAPRIIPQREKNQRPSGAEGERPQEVPLGRGRGLRFWTPLSSDPTFRMDSTL